MPPGQFLALIGVHLPQPQTVLPMRPFFPPLPPLTPLEPAVDYTGMTTPAPMVPPEHGEHSAGFGATPSRMPAEFERTVGDGVLLNTTAGANEVIYDTLGLPVDAMTWLLNQGLRGVNYAAGSDLRIRDPFLGSRWFARRGASVGIPDPASIVAVTPTERIARGTGAGAAYAVAPATMVRGGAALSGRQLGPLGQTVFGRAGSAGELGRDMAIGATAGGTGMATAELVPEPWKPTAMVVGGLLGGAAAARALAPGAVAQTAARPAGGAEQRGAYGRSTGEAAVRPGPSPGRPGANDPVGTGAAATGLGSQAPKYDGIALTRLDWDLPRFVFRGESRPESEIFLQGFTPRGKSTDLLAHAIDNRYPRSAFVPSSRDFDVATRFGNNVYVVKSRNGIDVNRALGPDSPYPHEHEIAIYGGVLPPIFVR